MPAVSELNKVREDCARKYLKSVRQSYLRLARATAKDTEQRQAMQPKGLRYTGMPASPNSYGDAIPDGVIKLAAISDVIDSAKAEWEESISQALLCLYSMEDAEQSFLLESRYIYGQTRSSIANSLGRSVAWCSANEKIALGNLYDLMPSQWRLPSVQAV